MIFRYAEIKNVSLSDVVSEMIGMIEDEIDSMLCDKALYEFENSGEKSKPINELWKELGV